MTLYVQLQQSLIDWLYQLNDERPALLKALVDLCRRKKAESIPWWPELLRALGFPLGDEEWHREIKFHELILEQVDDSGDQMVILNLLGSPVYRYRTYNLEGWITERGSGGNALRCTAYSQPGALQVGDVLVTGERVIAEPRQGGNGAVLVKLSGGGERGVWLSFPSRTALALIGAHQGPIPDGLVEE